MHAQGLRVVLVAAALIALLHGLLLKALEPDQLNSWRDRQDRQDRQDQLGRGDSGYPGRAHDGRPHETLGQLFVRSREDDLREMFEFASQASRPLTPFKTQDAPVRRENCSAPLELDSAYVKDPASCTSGPEAAGYLPAAIVNHYKNEGVTTGGTEDGVAAYDGGIGFGGSVF